jgi:putative endonuclease
MNKGGYVYILASKRNGTLYIGVTSNLKKRIYEHKEGKIEGFTKRHNVKIIVYYETFGDIESAIYREKCLKEWNRSDKIKLIEKKNIKWNDLYDSL